MQHFQIILKATKVSRMLMKFCFNMRVTVLWPDEIFSLPNISEKIETE